MRHGEADAIARRGSRRVDTVVSKLLEVNVPLKCCSAGGLYLRSYVRGTQIAFTVAAGEPETAAELRHSLPQRRRSPPARCPSRGNRPWWPAFKRQLWFRYSERSTYLGQNYLVVDASHDRRSAADPARRRSSSTTAWTSPPPTIPAAKSSLRSSGFCIPSRATSAFG